MNYKSESDAIVGIINRHCTKLLSHESLYLFLKELELPICSSCVQSIDLFSDLTYDKTENFDEYYDSLNAKLTVLLKKDEGEYILFIFYIHTFDDCVDACFTLELKETEIFNIRIAQSIENLIGKKTNKKINSFFNRSIATRGGYKLFLRDTYLCDFSELKDINDSSEFIKGFIKGNYMDGNSRFIK